MAAHPHPGAKTDAHMDRLQDLLPKGTVLFDGAMGTELWARGVAPGRCLEELNLSDPSLVAGVHRDYIAAGVDVIETNTFGANRFNLGEHYLEHLVRQLNLAGARIAVESRNASGRPVLVAGSVGPLGRPIEPVGAIKRASAERMFQEQIEALVEGGVDLLVLETFTALHELVLAVEVANRVAPHIPVVAQMSFDDEANPAQATQALVEALSKHSIAALGANCGSGPQAVLNVARHLLQARARLWQDPVRFQDPGAAGLRPPAISAIPNAGLPHRQGGRLVYTAGPDYFADFAAQAVALGVGIVGGCCGTRPAHIQAMRARLDGARPAARVRPLPASAEPEQAQRPPPATRLAAQLLGGHFAISVELSPPRGIDPRRVLEAARLLKERGVEFVNVTDSAMARLRMGVISCAALIQQQVGLEPIAHFTCRDRNVMAIQSELIGAHALGIRNILALRGDPPRVGDYPNATPVWDVNAVGLITILAGMNRGLDANGTPIGARASFHIGAAFNPAADDPAKELRLLHRKVAAGAAFVVSNPVFDEAALQRLLQVAAGLRVPVLAGVMPLASSRHAEYLHHEVPGISIPSATRERLQGAGERAAELGLEMAFEFLEAARPHLAGAYIIPAAGRYDLAARLVEKIREMVG